MSDWIHVTGYMVIGDSLPCKMGKKYEIDPEDDFSTEAELCGLTVSEMIGKVFVAMRNKWKYWHEKPYNPFGHWGRVLWKLPQSDDDGKWIEDKEDEEWFIWDELKLDDDTNLLEALQFPCGSEGPLDLTIIPHVDEWGTSWHVVFDGNLRDRESGYFGEVKKWWLAVQKLLNIHSGYICCTWLDNKWKDEV